MIKKSLILIFCFFIMVFCVVNFINFSTKKYIYSDVNSLPQTEAAIIFGAGILRSGDLGETVKDRTDQAIAIYVTGKVGKIIVAGNGHNGFQGDEITPVLKYLNQAGIASTSIVLDGFGMDTYSSIYHAKNTKSVTLVSQSFHLPRAVFIARRLGLPAYGLKSDNGGYSPKNFFREIFADIKAVFDIAIKRKP